MPIAASHVGTLLGPRVVQVSKRQVVAYSAGLGQETPALATGIAGETLVAHPMFPVSLEWPLIQEGRRQIARAEESRGVHATHDVQVHRLVRAQDTLTTRGQVMAIRAMRSGTYVLTRLQTSDATGALVATTWYGSLYRGVAIEGIDASIGEPAVVSTTALRVIQTAPIAVPSWLGAVYSECSGIWNPIHTDPDAARAAGLPGVILHGSASLALAVSTAVALVANGDLSRVTRVRARFAAMVRIPSVLDLRILEAQPSGVPFVVMTEEGQPAIRDAIIGLS